MKVALFSTPASRPWFYWFVLISGTILLGLYVITGWMIVRYGPIRKELGWEEEKKGSEWFISYVFPNGPAAATLQAGDRILALNGDIRAGRIGPSFKLLEIPPEQTSYTIRVARGSNELEFALSMPLSRNLGNLWHVLPSFPVSLAFFIMGLLVGVLKADEGFARLGCLALLAAALSLLRETLLPLSEFFHGHERVIMFLLTGIFPLQFVLAYHFYYRFPPGVSPGRFWRVLKYVIYTTGALTFLWLNSVRLLSLRHGESAAMFFYEHPRLLDVYYSLRFSFELIAAIAIFAIIVRNYFKVKEPDQRRRSRLVLYGSVVGFFLVLISNVTFNIGYENPMGLASTTLDWVSSIGLILIPVSTGYAILKHRMFDINVVIRRTLQYLLAKHALQFILSLPLLGLIYTLLSNPNRTLAEVLFRNSVYFYALSFAAAAISLKFRQQLRLWIDRKFFREAYAQEKSLLDLIDKVKDLDSIPEIAKVVSHEVDAALHPKSIYLFYREEGRRDLSLGYSSGKATPDLCIPGDFQLLPFMEDQGGAKVLPFPPNNHLPQSEKDWLTQLEAQLIVPMSGTHNRIAGLLLLGEKKSEAAYTATDRTLLEALAAQIAIVYENVQLKQHIHKEGKLKREVLARFEERNINLLKECTNCGACYDNHEQACTKDRNELILSLPVERTIDGKYRLDQLLGKGGMGAVYAATDLRIRRQVAVKIMLGNLFGDHTALGRFKREARACAKLSHPNIIAIYDFGVISAGSAEGAYMVMEMVRGSTLRAEIKRDKVLHPETAAGYFKQTLDGVEAAHGGGVIHRDLKPENILLTALNGKQICVKILDFGLAQIRQPNPLDSVSLPVTSPGTVMGTLAYMSPEQIEGKELDERSDLFTIGVMVVEALTGQRPFNGGNYQQLLKAILQDSFHLPGETREIKRLDRVLQKCLAKDPANRFRSATEMQAELIPAILEYAPRAAYASTIHDSEMSTLKTSNAPLHRRKS